jgi:hypothetical protein
MTLRILILLLLIAFPLSAQDATLTPTDEPFSEGFVFKWSADVIFPEGIRFFIALRRPEAQLESVTLTIQHEGGEAFTQDVPFDEPVYQGEDFADLVWIWEFAPDDLPQVFGEVAYEWLVVDTNGEEGAST